MLDSRLKKCGVEMELKRGEPHPLYEIALKLLDSVPLRIDHLSKGDRGYELLVQEQTAPVRAQPLKLKKRDTVEDAFRRIATNCLAQVHGNERGVVSGHDPSSVHQMRVGLRRLRSALDPFEGQIAAPAGLQEELRWIAGELGGARDWEVLAGSTLKQAFEPVSDERDAVSFRQAAKEMATENRARAASAVDSVRYTRLVLEVTRWVETSGWREGRTDEERQALNAPVKKFASKALYRRHKKLISRRRNLAELDDESRHRARIAAKKLRYAAEFFASLYSKRAVAHYTSALSELQDDLGWRNDMVVADELLKSLPVSRPETAAGASFARGYLASRVATDHDALRSLWKRFKRLSPPQ
ncbi:metal-chelation protein CHAD [Caballeronia glathei]|uniref:Metal-chelation protein CHAD n=2 Tax=Caballeronia glathei TaxID=60547 RepID=A0A069PAA1_9BURK|nr:CHAD domain-containing protein [Caballeronia glathei]KDR37580.1 metal-chelation protein CHAD [Caballeronia glathei]